MADEILPKPEPETTQETKPTEKKRHKKIPGIYKRGNRWQIDATYKGIRLQETCATLEMAEAVLRKQKTSIDEDKYLDKERRSTVTLGEFAERYLAYCENSKKQKDIRSKKQRLGIFLTRFGKDTLLSKITTANIEDYRTERSMSVSRYGTKLSVATLNRELAAIKGMFTWAVKRKEIKIEMNPARSVTLVKENNGRTRYLSQEECRALLDACPSATMRSVVTLALNTGMRRGEILHLKWKNVNLREGYLEIIEQKNGETSTIPLNSTAVDTLRAIPRRLDSDYVFTGKIPGEPFYDLKRQFEKALAKAKLNDVSFHTLRHSCASHLVMAGVDLATVREILRHKDYKTTLRYAHLAEDHKKAAVEALGNALAAESGKAEQVR
jgi:integrase